MSAQERLLRDETPSHLSKDTIFSMLSNQRRRYVLYYLKANPGPQRLRDVAEQIAAWENDVSVEALTYKQRKRVYTSLHQTHLPKLDGSGIVDYDRDRGTVELADRAADLDVYLEDVGEHDIPWCDFYLGLCALALLSLAGAWFDVFPFAAVPDIAFAAGVVVVFAVAAGAHSYLTRRNRIGGEGAPVQPPDDRA